MEIKKSILIGFLCGSAGFLLASALSLQVFSTTGKTAPSVLAEIAKDPDMVAYNYVIVDNDDGISYDGMTAVLKDATRLNVYFSLENGATIGSYTDFAVDGIPVTPSLASDGSYYVTVSDISAKELGNPHVITVGGLTISNLSAVTYVYRVSLLESPSEKTVALTEALYEYYKAAETYFCAEHDYVSETVVEATGRKTGIVKHTCKNCSGKYYEAVDYTQGLIFTLNAEGTGYILSDYTGASADIVLPSTYNGLPVTEIGASAFENDGITSVILPNGIEKIGANAFYGCDRLTRVYYLGAAEEWAGIASGEGNSLSDLCCFYSETQPTGEGNFWHYLNGMPTVWKSVTKITKEFKVGFWDSFEYYFTPTISGKYTVSVDSDEVSVIIEHNGGYIQNPTNALDFTAGESYKIEVVSSSGDDVTGILTIEYVR